MQRFLWISLLLWACFVGASASLSAQPLTLDSCHTLALRHNKTLRLAHMAIEQASHEERAAHTNYLPKVSLTAGYMHRGENLALLSGDQRAALSQIGTTFVGSLTPQLQQFAQGLLQLHPELAPLLQRSMAGAPQMAQQLNAAGQRIADAFQTDTRNVALGSVLLTQPLYMGGKIAAYHRITRLRQEVAHEQQRGQEQALRLDVEKAYWQVVSLMSKQVLATAHRNLLDTLRSDVQKMTAAGVATRANQLAVEVELNKAEMALAKVQDALTLSRMLLAQLCGLPLDASYQLADQIEASTTMVVATPQPEVGTAWQQRPEVRQLDLAAKIYQEKVKIERAAFLPQVALVGGWASTYPSMADGFALKVHGTWHAGLTLRMPLWQWGESRHKVRAAKVEAQMATLRATEARERIELQVHQSALAVGEAGRKLSLTQRNLEKANENLRMARVAHAEGIVPTSDLLAAQTAWILAQSEQLDAQIDIRLARAAYDKALGL